MTATDCYRTPLDAQLRYTVQWFHEWSEMQRSDFLPILAQKLAPGSYVNGVLSGIESMSCNEGRPPSLFQCRIKLFREWFETWGRAERDQFLGHIKSVDPAFYTKMQEELQSLDTSPKHTSASIDTEAPHSPTFVAEDETEIQEAHAEAASAAPTSTEDSSSTAENDD